MTSLRGRQFKNRLDSYKVFISLCKNIDVPTDDIEGTVLRISMDLVKNIGLNLKTRKFTKVIGLKAQCTVEVN
jgi:hypothetical protein